MLKVLGNHSLHVIVGFTRVTWMVVTQQMKQMTLVVLEVEIKKENMPF
jgi:hypothetical protein